MNVLSRPVLLLNKLWQPIGTKTVQEIMPMLVTDVATAMIIDGDEIRPVCWEEWSKLPVREQDEAIHTPKLTLRVPTVAIAINFASVPKRRPKISLRTIWERDKATDQYTGKRLSLEDSSVDHVIPRARGGQKVWENCVLASKEINVAKGNRTPSEAGLRLLRQPRAPLPVPAMVTIRNTHQIPDWDLFLHH